MTEGNAVVTVLNDPSLRSCASAGRAVVYGAFQNVRTRAIGEKNDDGHGSIVRFRYEIGDEICQVQANQIVTR